MANEKKVPHTKNAKIMLYTIQFRSKNLFEYMNEDGGKAIGALTRIGSLLLMVSKDEKLNGPLSNWFDSIFISTEQEIEKIESQKNVFAQMLEFDMPPMHIPKEYVYEVEIHHPTAWKLINLIKKVDVVLDEMEALWFAGVVTQPELDQAKTQSLAVIRKTIQSIFEVTAPGKREGGPFSPQRFIQVMRANSGIAPLVKDEEPIKKAG